MLSLALEHITQNVAQKMHISAQPSRTKPSLATKTANESGVTSPRKAGKSQNGSAASKSGSGSSPRSSSSKRPRYSARHRRSGSNASATSFAQAQKHQAIARELNDLQSQEVRVDYVCLYSFSTSNLQRTCALLFSGAAAPNEQSAALPRTESQDVPRSHTPQQQQTSEEQ